VTRTPLSRSKGQWSRSPGRFTHRGLNASGSCSGERGNVLGAGNYWYVAVCSAALGASAPTEGGEGWGISWRPPAYSLFVRVNWTTISLCIWPTFSRYNNGNRLDRTGGVLGAVPSAAV